MTINLVTFSENHEPIMSTTLGYLRFSVSFHTHKRKG